MNKTIDINLAGFLFHIDEEAYIRLNNYLKAIEDSLANEEGKTEIIADIESRIAELFFEKQVFKDQVISEGMVNEVIAIMGEPKDYEVDETSSQNTSETHHTAPLETSTPKKLFRDPNDAYAGGVSSGLGHYFNISPAWIRLSWVLFTIFSGGSFILIYLAFWLFVPKAKTTSEQLEMKGEPVTVSNIEEENRTEKQNERRPSVTFFENAGEIISKFFLLIAKFFASLFVFITGVTIIALIFGFLNFLLGNGRVFLTKKLQLVPSLEVGFFLIPFFLALAIPLFLLLAFCLRIISKKIKPLKKQIIYYLLGVWGIAVLTTILYGVNESKNRRNLATISTTEKLLVDRKDTLKISSVNDINSYVQGGNTVQKTNSKHSNNYSFEKKDGKKVLLLHKNTLVVKPSPDSLVHVMIVKKAKGKTNEEATENAKAIEYGYKLVNRNHLLLSTSAISPIKNKWRDQQLVIHLLVPRGMVISPEHSLNSFKLSNWKQTIPIKNRLGKHITIGKSKTCKDCSDTKNKTPHKAENNINLNFNDGNDKFRVKIDETGIHIKGKSDEEDFQLNIDENGIEINGEKQ